MAEDEQFSLSWNNFNSNLSAGFHESLCRGDLVDVTLAADGQLVKAHRLVLSVCSPYFRKMFTQMPANQHAFVFLKDVSHAALKDLIQFMYCGEVNVKQDALPAFISTAEALQIKGLTETGESVPQTQPQTTTTVLTAAPVTVAKESTRITTVPVHQTIATTSRTFKSPRVSATTAYKLAAAAGDSEDSADDKVVQAMTMQAQATSTPATVHTTVKRTQKSITPQSAPASKRMKVQTSTADPLEAVEPTQITMHGDKDDEFINIPIEQLQNPKTEPHDTQYAEQASAAQVTEVEGHEQDTTYVEDDGTYGEIAKYDDSYFTEGDETAKAGQSSFGESYTATTDQGQEAQDLAMDFCDVDIKEEYDSNDGDLFREIQPPQQFSDERYYNPFSHYGVKKEKHGKLENVFLGEEVVVQTINTQGKQKPMYIYYDGYRFTKDSSRFSKGLNTEQIYWRCSMYKHTKCRSRLHTTVDFMVLKLTHPHSPLCQTCEPQRV
ncbi:modifier of mdg4-like isoform X6 [Culicoides brevitarsis]|uniref:modifier of mdg4-like isoform X6 n=1 Tax=Culicoides brevitarsis TaxID=469753 RepID=UPI00307BDA91